MKNRSIYQCCCPFLFFKKRTERRESLGAGTAEISQKHPLFPCMVTHLVRCWINGLSELRLTHCTNFYWLFCCMLHVTQLYLSCSCYSLCSLTNVFQLTSITESMLKNELLNAFYFKTTGVRVTCFFSVIQVNQSTIPIFIVLSLLSYKQSVLLQILSIYQDSEKTCLKNLLIYTSFSWPQHVIRAFSSKLQ